MYWRFKFLNIKGKEYYNNTILNKMALASHDIHAKINDGWEKIKKNAIRKLEHYLSTGETDCLFSKKEWMDYYT